ncbi:MULTISPECIES: fumarylacetoacetate hydrolase family protein [unclassified Brevibacterium]|uniref:2-keto-4-pentenoate hydratase n=1 Tax=unclassified Brevibacterium TaxID=2614124 RepID=UPI0010F824E3|nr:MULTISPECIES: fumarylacetoacetate hydrolase family protein [unclassified Brevibacterium]MCM1011724.1 fumarylacetoacetate hydrolase family protein [Brevibacterium sp. XM4083]
MSATDPRIAALADSLQSAAETGQPIPRPSAADPDLSLADAYRVQETLTAARRSRGEVVVGRKVGLTSTAMQRQLGVDQPDFGILTDAMVVDNGESISLRTLIAPRLEPEFAFRFAAPVPADLTPTEVRDAIDAVAIAIEIIDSRVENWDIGLVDTVADNASSAAVVLGPWREASAELLDALITTEITLTSDSGDSVSGPGSAVLGDPTTAVQWLAGALGGFGATITAGSFVIAGAVTAAVPAPPETRWTASAPGFESVELGVTP